MRRLAALFLAFTSLQGLARAQVNADPAIDVFLAEMSDLTAVGRQGAFPGGLNGCVFRTTACNLGTKVIQWKAPMLADHPFIAFLLARESNGRFEQISNRSFVKHGYFALSSTLCGACTSPADNSLLGIGCSDTYSVNSNGNLLYLGPPEEIDPWLGRWDPACSYFDRGDPARPAPLDCDGVRSLSSSQVTALGLVANRILVADADFATSSAKFYFQAQYVLATEPEAARANNLGSREFLPQWTGTVWSLSGRPGGIVYGSVLSRWSGSSVSSATNGADDGRVYVAVKTSGPDPATGLYHYEYAVHNRDNARGVGALRIPVCAGARVVNLGFGDIDDEAANDWSAGVTANEVVFASGANPLAWNTIYNFWFESDAAPAAGELALTQAARGPGADVLRVTSSAPLELFDVTLGPGCARGTPPSLFAVGTPPRATLGNASFALRSAGNAPNQPSRLAYSLVQGSHVQGGCTRYLGPVPGLSAVAGLALADGGGVVEFAAPVPNDPALEGRTLELQALSRAPGAGVLGSYVLSDGLRVRIGDALSGCP